MAYEGSKLEYTAAVDSAALKDEAKLSVSADGVAVTTLFNPVFIAFADIVSFERRDFAVVVATDSDRFTFDRLGNLLDAFYLELYGAFNAKVRKALFVKGDPGFRTEGEFDYAEAGVEAQGRAAIEVYDDCVLLLPPDDRARRIPFAFMNGLRKGDFELTLTLDGGERYSFLRLGSNTDAFEACVKDKLYRFRENAIAAARALDAGLDLAQLSAIAGRMPEGVAAPMGFLTETAPSFAAALEAKIGESRAADTYAAFKGICDPAEICAGMKTGLAGEQADNVLWFIAPSKTKPAAAVEFATDEDTAAATFVYGIPGTPDIADMANTPDISGMPDTQNIPGNVSASRELFIRQLNRALEAIDFHREVISLPVELLKRTENGDYYMAVKRTAALRFARENLTGRVIHSSPEAWAEGIRRYLE